MFDHLLTVINVFPLPFKFTSINSSFDFLLATSYSLIVILATSFPRRPLNIVNCVIINAARFV